MYKESGLLSMIDDLDKSLTTIILLETRAQAYYITQGYYFFNVVRFLEHTFHYLQIVKIGRQLPLFIFIICSVYPV